MKEKTTRIFRELQEGEDYIGGHTLLTNEEIAEILCSFGNGYTEFHTIDVERLVLENEKMREMLEDIYVCQLDSSSSLNRLNSLVGGIRNFFDEVGGRFSSWVYCG